MRTLLKAKRVVDVVQGKLLENTSVLVEADKIIAVDVTTAPEGVKVIDLGDVTLMPGMIDVHLHLCGIRTWNDFEVLEIPLPVRTLRAAHDCQKLLQAGFTTVRDLGDIGGRIALSLKEAIAEGSIPGPTIYAAGPMISQTGGHGDVHSLTPEDAKRLFGCVLADGVDACRRAVREAVRDGADVIKICTTGGVGSLRDHPNDEHFTLEEIRAITDEAHRLGRRVASHAQGKAGVMNAVKGGVDTIEHGYFLDEECIALMLEHHTYYVPTFALIESFKRTLVNPKGVPEWRLKKQREVMAAMERSFALAKDSGLVIGAGPDYYGVQTREHGDNADEVITMVNYGMKPMEALRVATLNGAKVIGIEEQTGSLESQKHADIIAVAGNPLEDITTLRNVKFVMKQGTVYKLIAPV
jgi:imidazolonepropionase-like amidohydrolase